MEPIGTITSYFTYIDEETKTVLENVMKAASDYDDFVSRLGELVLNTESPVMVVYFAIHHSILTLNYKLIDQIREKYGGLQILGPNLFMSSAFQGKYEDVKKVHKLADAVLATNPEDWVALEMHFMKFEADMSNYPTTMYQTSTMDSIRALIDGDSRFGLYDAILQDYLAIRAHADGNYDERIRCINKALRIAEKFDDRLRVAHFLIRKANIILNQDRVEARELLEQAYEVVDSSLRVPAFYEAIIDKLALINAVRGEFDMAIRRFLRVVSIRERSGLNSGNASWYLSTLYNIVGEPDSGLEWASMAEDQLKSRPILMTRATLNQVWSLVLLKRLSEAQLLLESIRESVLKSGVEDQLAWLYFVSGIMEMAQGDYQLASSSIEQGLRIYEQLKAGHLMELIFLYQLAKTEVYSSMSEDIVSPSLAILEDKAVTEDLPGFLGQVLLLKADIALLMNDEDSLREIVLQLQPLSEKENLQFLKSNYDRLLSKL
ncbi:MAG: hypothetical protein ACFFE2_14320 [Candidatus Thorarchaeota archaeon]